MYGTPEVSRPGRGGDGVLSRATGGKLPGEEAQAGVRVQSIQGCSGQ